MNNNQENDLNKQANNNIADMDNNTNNQNDYYNNDAYYDNNNYSDNYSDTTYEEPEKKKGIWWKILAAILVLLIIIILLLKFCTGGSTADDKFEELRVTLCAAAEKYIAENATLLDSTKPGTTTTIKLQKLADASLIKSQIANPNYEGGLFKKSTESKYYSLNNSVRLTVQNDGTTYCEMVDNSTDTTAPELRLSGDAEISLAVGTEFSDPGYTATDDYDGDVTDKVVRSGNVDNAKAGEYTITYTVSDSAGNTTTKTRKVVIEEYADLDITLGTVLDKVTPMISLKGSNPYCLVKGSKYVEPGAVATDNVDGDITNRIAVTNKITGNLMGAFRVTYKVADSSGNEAIAYRAVIVTTACPENTDKENIANNAPVITLIGKNSVTISKGTSYLDLGATAYDKEDGDITNKITTDTTAVNVNSAGVYKVHYRVTDSAGALATAVRTVTVKENVSGNPSVRFTGTKSNITVEVEKGSDSLIGAPKAVNENGVAVAVSTSIEDYTTKVKVNAIDWNRVGKYRVTYTATHGNGVIKQTKSIIVTITEKELLIGGKNPIVVTKRDENCDLTEADLLKGGVTFNVGSSTPIVEISGTERMACTIGTYDITIKATTTEGQSTSKKITVQVVDGTSTLDVTAPSKVIITSNTANTSDPYNTTGKWVGGAVTGVTLTFTAIPAANTKISHYEFSTDCINVTDLSVRIGAHELFDLSSQSVQYSEGGLTYTREGKVSACIRAVTTAGSKGPWSNPVKLYIDKTGPSVEFTHAWADEKEDWHNDASLTVSYKATDEASGLDHFEYTYDDVKAKKAEEITTYNEASGSLKVNETTEPTRSQLFVYVRAVDKAGNVGEWTTNPAFANIDTVKPYAPTMTVTGNGTSVVKLTANISGIDAPSTRPSGFGKFLYTVDGGSELTETSNVVTAPANTTTANVNNVIKVWTVDKAGNKSDLPSENTVTVAPTKTLATGVTLKNGSTEIVEGASCSPATITTGSTLTLTATPVPVDADQKDVVWSTTNANVATIDATGKVTIKTVGTTTITAKIGTVKKSCIINATAVVPTPDSDPDPDPGSTCIYDTKQKCESAFSPDSSGNQVVTCEQKDECWFAKVVCGLKTQNECNARASNVCKNGYTGCSGPDNNGCYSYYCKSTPAPTPTCTYKTSGECSSITGGTCVMDSKGCWQLRQRTCVTYSITNSCWCKPATGTVAVSIKGSCSKSGVCSCSSKYVATGSCTVERQSAIAVNNCTNCQGANQTCT